MKAVFVHKQTVLRDSHIAEDGPGEDWRLTPATAEAMRALATDDRLVFLYGPASPATEDDGDGGDGADRVSTEIVRQIEAGGGRVDGVVVCSHADAGRCRCWGDFAGIFWLPAAELGLHLGECFALGDGDRDVATASAAGIRPMVVLSDRTIGDVFGDLPSRKDFPVTTDLATAVRYIGTEEEIRQELGVSRVPELPMPAAEELYADARALPQLVVISRQARGLQTRVVASRAQLGDIARWLTFFSLGALGLSLGVAYLLTHLYRVQPFPAFAYYATLQFIPRPMRGALFIVMGGVIIGFAVYSLRRAMARWRNRGAP